MHRKVNDTHRKVNDTETQSRKGLIGILADGKT